MAFTSSALLMRLYSLKYNVVSERIIMFRLHIHSETINIEKIIQFKDTSSKYV